MLNGQHLSLFYRQSYSVQQVKTKLKDLLSSGAGIKIQRLVLKDLSLIGNSLELWLPLDDEVDMLIKGNIDTFLPEESRRVSDSQINFIRTLQANGLIKNKVNFNGDLKSFFNYVRGLITLIK